MHKSTRQEKEIFFSTLVAVWKAQGKKRACVVRGHMLTLDSLAGDEKKHLSVVGTPGLIQAQQIPSPGLEVQPGSNRQKKNKSD